MPTTNELSAKVGSHVDVLFNGPSGELLVTCKVLDARSAFGYILLLVTPLKGSGNQWVREERTTAVLG